MTEAALLAIGPQLPGGGEGEGASVAAATAGDDDDGIGGGGDGGDSTRRVLALVNEPASKRVVVRSIVPLGHHLHTPPPPHPQFHLHLRPLSLSLSPQPSALSPRPPAPSPRPRAQVRPFLEASFSRHGAGVALLRAPSSELFASSWGAKAGQP